MNALPTVSVCIPTYNGSAYIAAAVRSVLGQTFTDFELIVVDDCSTDNTWAVVSTFRDDRLQVVKNTARLGLVGNWNRCLELASGTYITIFHQDDVMHPGNLAAKVGLLESLPSVGMVYSDIHSIDTNGDVVGGHWIKQPVVDTVRSGREFYEAVAATGNPVSCPAVMVRKACYEQLGGFNPGLPFAVDLEMWLRIARHYDIAFLAEPLILQRTHPAQETSRFQGTGHDYLDVLRVFEIAFDASVATEYLACRPEAYRTLFRQSAAMARWKLRCGQIRYGLMYFRVAALAGWRAQARWDEGVAHA